MNRIAKEQKLSEQYHLKIVKGTTNLVELSQDNVARVEAMIHHNSSYQGEYVKYCRDLAEVLDREKYVTSDEYKELIENLVKTMDSSNSTHLNADRVGRKVIVDRILSIRKADLVRYLKCPVETNYKLFNILAEETNPNAKRSRRNPSFARKFCHYMCFYLFEGQPEQDNYSIYNNVVRRAIPMYAEYYELSVKKKDLTDYLYYQQVIDEIIKLSGAKISRNGFDHLLWYCNK